MGVCVSCGKETESGRECCHYCGTPVRSGGYEPVSPPDPSTASDEAKSGDQPPILMWGLGLMGVMVISLTLFFGGILGAG